MTRGLLNAGMWKCLPFLTSHAHASPSTPCRTGDDLVLCLHTSVQLLGLIAELVTVSPLCRAASRPKGSRLAKNCPTCALMPAKVLWKEQCCCSGCAPRARSSMCQCRQRGQGAGLTDNRCFIFPLYWIRYNLDLFSSFAHCTMPDKNKWRCNISSCSGDSSSAFRDCVSGTTRNKVEAENIP